MADNLPTISTEEKRERLRREVERLRGYLKHYVRRTNDIQAELILIEQWIACDEHEWSNSRPGLYGNTIYQCKHCGCYG